MAASSDHHSLHSSSAPLMPSPFTPSTNNIGLPPTLSPSKPNSSTSRMEAPESRKLGGQLRFRPSSDLVFFLVLFLAGRDVRSDPQPGDCVPMRCGDGPNISYPFAIRHVQPPYCGYPGFEVSCEDDGRVVTDVGSEYYVNNIFYHNKSLIISSRNPCPRHNLSLDRTPYNISLINQRLFFYLNCTHRLPGYREISCGNSENGRASFVTEQPVQSNYRNAPEFCLSVFTRPFLASGGNYSDLLRSGFLLEYWKAPDCGRCESSGGRCGYNQTTKQFMCMCRDRVHLVRCQGPHNRWMPAVMTVVAVLGMLLLVCIGWYVCWRKKMTRVMMGTSTSKTSNHKKEETSGGNDLELPLYDFKTIAAATDDFAIQNKLGEGGFGPVYLGRLGGGQEVAVKRLAKNSAQGLDELKNEVMLIAKLQHRNLVRLLGCCIQGEERMLIYEYMPNKSLDAFLFHETKGPLLDWKKRHQIINGIARGLLYLHQDSRFRIIHRDLKISNVLLDKDMNPKISDFGLARICSGDETGANTQRVVGTHGYMSPEYIMEGVFSVKSDVFSFGVVVLEIVSGKRNRGIILSDPSLNLLGYAWSLLKAGKVLELVDSSMGYSVHVAEVLKCIKVGLLCVQERPEDRPTMASVVHMLGSNTAPLPQPKQPGFMATRGPFEVPSFIRGKIASVNKVTITMVEGR